MMTDHTISAISTISLPNSAVDQGPLTNRGLIIDIEETTYVTRKLTVVIGENISPNKKELIRDVIENLLNRLDFMGHELNYQSGAITDEEFDKIANEILTDNEINIEELAYRIAEIYPFIKNKERIGSELFSTLFQCNIDIAQEAVGRIIVQSSLPGGGHSD